MAVSTDEVKRIASLARLELTEDEAARMAGELSQILDFAASIGELDTANVTATSHVLDMANVVRADEPGQSLDRDTVLAQSPESEDGCFLAPRIV